MRVAAAIWLLVAALAAAPLQGPIPPNTALIGMVRGAGLPLPGATVTATRGKLREQTVTGNDGAFAFTGLAPGTWNVRFSMTGFVSVERQVDVREPPQGQPAAALTADLRIATLAVIAARSGTDSVSPLQPLAAKPESDGTEANSEFPGLFSVNGSVDNSAGSVFAQSPAFGNNRPRPNALFNGSFGFALNSSALDARGFSLTGHNTPKPDANDITGLFSFGGPLVIPHLLSAFNAPVFFVAYQKENARDAVTTAALVPTPAERAGDLSALGGPLIPSSAISPQAQALLDFYPLPNVLGQAFNYQIPLIGNRHMDSLQTRLNRIALRGFQFSGSFNLQSTRSDNSNLFGFDDADRALGLNADISARRGFAHMLFATLGISYSRMATRRIPFFANRLDVAAAAGIAGGATVPADWGPPALAFSSGFAGLGDGNPADLRNQTVAFTSAWTWVHRDHNLDFGGDIRRLEFNGLAQPNPRGSFVFNGEGSGSDFEDFLLGLPDAVSLVYGDAGRHFRQSTYDLYASDDWRASDSLTLDLGARWEYEAPLTERADAMVNLDVAPGFAAVAPVLASDPVGRLSGVRYPDSLLRPDKGGIEPRLGLAWQPFAGSIIGARGLSAAFSSLILRSGYGVYRDSSVYPAIATRMAEQSPLWRSLNVAAAGAAPLSLASGLLTPSGASLGVGPDLFGIDPNFRVGYVQTWNASAQTDLPASLVLILSYLGNKGTRGVQLFLPNSYAPGVANPCPACPSGFVFETSNGSSTYEAGLAEIERRFAGGFAATLTYTYAKALDDDSLIGGAPRTGGAAAAGAGSPSGSGVVNPVLSLAQSVAQNWRDLDAERGPSNFDQRQKLTLTAQYSTGTGLRGGLLMSGWRGPIFRGWTITTQLTAAGGLPLTPTVPAVIGGTGFTGIRPDLTGAGLYAADSGRHLNPAAFALPAVATWGDAGRNSLVGPGVFDLDVGVQRSFTLARGLRANLRLDATNALNHVTYPSWDAVVGSAQFGLPLAANAMRSVRATLRVSF